MCRAVSQMPVSQAGVQQVVVRAYARQSVGCLAHKQAYSVLIYSKVWALPNVKRCRHCFLCRQRAVTHNLPCRMGL